MRGGEVLLKALCVCGWLSHRSDCLKKVEFPVSLFDTSGRALSLVLRFAEGDCVNCVVEDFVSQHAVAGDVSLIVSDLKKIYDGRKDLHPLSLKFDTLVGMVGAPSGSVHVSVPSSTDEEVCTPLIGECRWRQTGGGSGCGGETARKGGREGQRSPVSRAVNGGEDSAAPSNTGPSRTPGASRAAPFENFRDFALSGGFRSVPSEYIKGEAGQDVFAMWAFHHRRGGAGGSAGFYVELGASHPFASSNCYALEVGLGWRGLLVELDSRFAPMYREQRPRAHAVIGDATTLNYPELLGALRAPKDIDYLQIDLDEENGSTMAVLENFDRSVFPLGYRFAAVTFEHDVYISNVYDTRKRSREIFAKHGYIRAVSDVAWRGGPFEDWYVHPELVSREAVEALIALNHFRRREHPAYPGVQSILYKNVLLPM
uniref:Methyltransferase FkbM domain-containing protein n=1 Tax=Chromera velia CCMP2878 TaxID=1169474 RepID=A0A0G4I524_9ALVE|eukprot:Cvel_11065.t1-p1 / transcript=Cvel_11065.t1 / gene=Cvel_11065 / organism=Chromera_velia_CCMP2878 / gene_product=hypothetical protein / transcript_product=hypothetical protein / location=Cvel_scaffold683:5368-6648(-) / protein_length=427 / sequence_SO=supercontig / SO=protein_coding / is_pseudo=false